MKSNRVQSRYTKAANRLYHSLQTMSLSERQRKDIQYAINTLQAAHQLLVENEKLRKNQEGAE